MKLHAQLPRAYKHRRCRHLKPFIRTGPLQSSDAPQYAVVGVEPTVFRSGPERPSARPPAVQIGAVVRNTVIAALRLAAATNTAEARRWAASATERISDLYMGSANLAISAL
jgi:hypothetical protein